MSSRKAGLTLVELLVVVSTIVLLLAMLVPSLARGIMVARETACRQRIHNVAEGVHAYGADHGSVAPPDRFSATPGEWVTWRTLLTRASYLPVGPDWMCPLGPTGDELSEQDCVNGGATCTADVASHFALNGTTCGRWVPFGAPDGCPGEDPTGAASVGLPAPAYDRARPLKLCSIAYPDRVYLLLERRGALPDIGHWLRSAVLDDGYGHFANWHRDLRSNWAMSDGHVEWLQLPETFAEECRWHNQLTSAYCHAHPDWITDVPEPHRRLTSD